MSEKEKESNSRKAKPRKQIKASTGAWWNSTVVDVEESNDQQSSPPETKKTTPKRTRKSPAKKPAQKKVEGEQSTEPATEAPAAPSKRAGSRRPRKRKKPEVPAEQVSEEAGSPVSKDREQKADTTVIEPEHDAVTDVPEEKGSEDKVAKKPRQARGRRGPRKRQAPKKQEKDLQPKSADDAPAKTDTVPQGAESPPEKTQPEPVAKSEKGVEKAADPGDDKSAVVKLLINAEEPEECRLALLEDGRLESIHVTTVGKIQTKNNIYKARVVAIEPNLQAAFVDYGTEKNGFLPFNEIHPEYYKQELSSKISKLVETHQWKKLSISDVMEKGQELLVQVVKEEIGKKGANLTTYLSLPGRCVVLMPGSDSEGISRKISGEEKRGKLRDVMNSMNIPEGIGWIVRTASEDITKTALSKDVRFLMKLWREIKSKGQHMDGVGLLYQDYNCVMRFLREYYDPSIQEILVDDDEAMEKVRDFVDMLPAKQRKVRIKQHRGARPIFNQYSVEDQIESIYQPRVNLPSGGSIVIEPTEALVSIDVNSGSTSKGRNFEETIFQANMEAAGELARQLRLRDLGGLIVVDFIDMRNNKHVREVEKRVKTTMKRDKAKVDVSRISRFGLMQISRQKMGSPIESGNYHVCDHCRGRGTVRSVETQALFYFRRIHTGASRKQVMRIDCRFPLDIAEYLLNNKRHELLDLEEKYNTRVMVIADPTLKPSQHEITFVKSEKEGVAKKQA